MIIDDPSALDLVVRDRDFVIYNGNDTLLTPGGHEFSHPGERFIKHLLTDLVSGISQDRFCSLQIFIRQKDLIEAGDDPFACKFEALLKLDIFVQVKSGRSGFVSASGTGIPGNDSVDNAGVNFRLWIFSVILNRIQDFLSCEMVRIEAIENEDQPFELLLRTVYEGLSSPEKAVAGLLSERHGSGIVLPILLVTGRITPSEYSKTLQVLGLTEPVRMVSEASAAVEYLVIVRDSESPLKRYAMMIRSGEGSQMEFKSTLRWDLKAGKTNQLVERACLKTISAFLNSQGGILLIGVRDDGSIEGIESDRFPNADKFLLHLWTLIRTSFGRDVSLYIQTSLEEVNGLTVCAVNCSRSARPVFLRQPGFNEEYYIRLGPGSVALDLSEALKYLHDHFPGFRV